MTAAISIHEAMLKLRRLHTLLVLGRQSNQLALAIRNGLELMSSWPQSLPLAAVFEKKSIRLVFAGYGLKFVKRVQELVDTGSMPMLEELQANYSVFFCELCELPGIGERGARRMFYDKMIESFDDLRVASANGVLKTIPSFGEARIRVIERWIQNRQQDPDFPACDVVVPAIPAQEECRHVQTSGFSQPAHPKTTINDEEFDFSEEDVFGNELDDALKEDLAALPELSFSEARKACCSPESTAAATSHVNIIRDDARVQRVSYFDVSHVSQIDLDFSQNDTRAVPMPPTRSWGPRYQSLASYAIARLMPPAFLTRFLACAVLHKLNASDEILLVGRAYKALSPCIDACLRDFEIGCSVVVANDLESCPNRAYARILVDPVDALDMTPNQIAHLLKRLAARGSLVLAVLDLNALLRDGDVSTLSPATLLKDVSSIHFSVVCENVEFATICIVSKRDVQRTLQF